MSEVIAIRPTDLLTNAENPRLPQPNQGQREALRSLARHQGRKLLVLAKDILSNGLNPADLPIVMPAKGDRGRYIVLEGNRRLVALRALENPELFAGAVDDAVLKEMRRLTKRYQDSPVEIVNCVSVKNSDESRHWIELRHTGENAGAGIVPWGSDEAARFRARTRGMELHSQALEFLERGGYLSAEERRNVPATSFRRLLGTPEVRAKVGIETQNRQMVLKASEKRVATALLYIAKDLASGKTKVADIYTSRKRIRYAQRLPARVVVTAAHRREREAANAGGKTIKTKRAKKTTRDRTRTRLIPRDCVLTVNDPRARDIESELRRLKLEEYPNATAVLLRVFVELSVDAYIDNNSLATKPTQKLRTKMQDVLRDLMKKKKLTAQQAKPVRRALQKGSYLDPSVDLMHQYVHNKHMFPAPVDLRANWDGLQPFVTALWSS